MINVYEQMDGSECEGCLLPEALTSSALAEGGTFCAGKMHGRFKKAVIYSTF